MTSIPYPLVRPAVATARARLSLDADTFLRLFRAFGPSLGLWRAAEIALLRRCSFARPILDLGCGDGLVTSFVLPQVDLGVDPWSEALARAGGLGVYRRLEETTIERTALPPEGAATIVSNSVLEHLPDIDDVLAAVARLLVPAGHLIFTVPTEAFGRWLLLPSERYSAWRNAAYEHRNIWTVAEWSRRLERAGLEIEEVRPYLRRRLVTFWDGLELAQRIWLGRRRVVGALWKSLPPFAMRALASAVSRLDLSSTPPGGGRLVVARRR